MEYSLEAALRPLFETTDEHRAAEPKPKRISPQRRRERGGSVPGSARFQRALGVQHLARRMRALPGAPRTKILASLQRIFGLVVQMDTDVAWIDPCESVFICGFLRGRYDTRYRYLSRPPSESAGAVSAAVSPAINAQNASRCAGVPKMASTSPASRIMSGPGLV